MPRIRTIKPDAYLSDSLSRVPRGTRWTFAGLWTYADDAGRARDDRRLIKAALYALDDTVDLDDISEDLALLAGIGVICRYEVEGRRYLHMPKWTDHQKINRPTEPKSPPCPIHEDGTAGHVVTDDDSLSDHGAITEPSTWERKGKEGKGKESEPADATPDPPQRLDVERLCNRLADRIEANGSKRPEINKGWRDAARLMLDRDKRTEEQVARCIDWCQSDEFWRGNVLSMPKLREKYDQMRIQSMRKNNPEWGIAEDEASFWNRGPQIPAAPPEIADDPERYAEWLDDWRRENGR